MGNFKNNIDVFVNQQQFDEISTGLLKLGYRINTPSRTDVIEYPLLRIYSIGVFQLLLKRQVNTQQLVTYNKDLILALAVMSTDDKHHKGEWYVCTYSGRYGAFTQGKLYQLQTMTLNETYAFINNNGRTDGWSENNHKYFRKATNEQIIAYFTKQELTKEQPFVLPEKWAVLNPHNDESHLLYDYANKYGTNRPYYNGTYFHFPGTKNNWTTVDRLCSEEGYTEITFEQFKKHVLNQPVMQIGNEFSVQAQGPRSELNKFITEAKKEGLIKSVFDGNSTSKTYYNFKDNVVEVKMTDEPKYPVVTVEQLRNHYFSQQTTKMERKIIGYKLIKPEYAEAVLKIEGHHTIGTDIARTQLLKDSEAIEKVKKAGVLDMWFEPVYEDDFKQGDWLYILQTGFRVKGDINMGDVKQVKSYNLHPVHKWEVEFTDGSHGHGSSISEPQFRLATPEEIRKAERIYVGEYHATFPTSSTVKFGCTTVRKAFVQELDDLMKSYPKNGDVEVKIKEHTITHDIVKRVLKKFEQL